MSAVGRVGWVLLLVAIACLHGRANAGTVTYIYSDQQGTPLAEADAGGTVTLSFDYRPYGSNYAGAGMAATPSGPGYTGHVGDPDTSLIYMQARYYDSAIGRFLSVDPIGPSEGDIFNFGRFVYANNNPISNTDPDGKQCLGVFCSDDYLTNGKRCEMLCLDASKDDSKRPAPPREPKGASTAATLATITVTATTSSGSTAAAASAGAVSGLGMVTLGAGLFVMDANGFHDLIFGTQGCYGSISCGATSYLSEGKKIPKPNVSGKDGAKDVPSWAKGERPNIGESGKDFADRLTGKKYGGQPTDKGPGSEWSKIKKWGDRSFTDP